MIVMMIAGMAALIFASRYLFLSPKLPIRLRASTQRFLTFASPAVLTAIWGPIVFMPEGQLALNMHNAYLWAALVAIVLAWVTRHVLLTTVVSFGCFLVLNHFL
ncbi:AzlD domain-containing protein [Motilimonas pumila]|uniref:AzlD domain-containing protein n=1 Tax=Motilimonas pumila TaxID=2303987 RepID=A0A418YEA5_9GAMM|nr:AzlD domain-containing protein [Motilimonas pumila]RJG47485.1 AzlD domain-containing protein [Motilimonas pumila]